MLMLLLVSFVKPDLEKNGLNFILMEWEPVNSTWDLSLYEQVELLLVLDQPLLYNSPKLLYNNSNSSLNHKDIHNNQAWGTLNLSNNLANQDNNNSMVNNLSNMVSPNSSSSNMVNNHNNNSFNHKL